MGFPILTTSFIIAMSSNLGYNGSKHRQGMIFNAKDNQECDPMQALWRCD